MKRSRDNSNNNHPTQHELHHPSQSSPISRVPLELFTEILRHMVLLHFTEEINPSLKEAWQRSFAWTRLSRVCHLWYNIISHTPALWCYIRVTPHMRSETLREILLRSNQMPLSIILDYKSFVLPYDLRLTLAALRAQRHRIRALELSTCGVIYAATFSQFLAEFSCHAKTSQMRKLTLDLGNSHMTVHAPVIDSMCSILSRESFPQLSDLTVLGITWNASMLRAGIQRDLRSLSLSGAAHWDVSPLLILTSLQELGCLQHLHLELHFTRCQDTQQTYNSIVNSKQPRACLDGLQELTVAVVGYGYASTALVTMIDVPETCHTSIEFHGMHPSKTSILNAVQLIGGKFLSNVKDGKLPEFRSFRLATPCTDNPDTDISFALWHEPITPGAKHIPKPMLSLKFPVKSGLVDLCYLEGQYKSFWDVCDERDIVDAWAATSSFDSITNVWFDVGKSKRPLDVNAWRQILGHMKAMAVLALSGCSQETTLVHHVGSFQRDPRD
ncbi:hypothetical protein QCA50_011028 [Cerrena zonata]|uniref:F-box domain-containing protein n=1 Tax=Cerrena zonata TaxID=2478898 RepID=A0AAW0G2Y3_9APHY